MTELSSISGIGAARLKELKANGITTVDALLRCYPRAYEDTSVSTPFTALEAGTPCCVEGFIKKVSAVRAFRGKTMVTATLEDGDGHRLPVVFFNQPWVAKQLREGQEKVYYGRPSADRQGRLQLVCPKSVTERGLVPVYRPIGSISGSIVKKLISGALPCLEECCPETLPRSLRLKHSLCEKNFAVRQIHAPSSRAQLDIALRRVAFEEALLYYIVLRDLRGGRTAGVSVPVTAEDMDRFAASLPYKMTGAQKRVLDEIAADLRSPAAMSRLVQGDVGSGKTVLAFAAIYFCKAHGYQSALMAPTEILARQHFESAKALLEPLGVRCALVTGGMKEKDRREILEKTAAGETDCLIGTHALIGGDIRFSALGLAVTDEQHRFGVRQRKDLGRTEEGAAACNTLVMSATPIPRTLSLILYGDLDISIVDEMPPGRKPVRTRAIPEEKRPQMYRFIIDEARRGRQAYIVCPFVEENEGLDVRSAQEEYAYLTQGPLKELRLGLTWGGQKEADKRETIRRFAAGETDVLVSTTVIEVGVNVPNATVMVIENADRFGLATLHQLRGRVGRGAEASWCFLMAPETERIKMLCATGDGFKIAEADLDMRGPGDFLGTRQHGKFEGFRLLENGKLLGEIQECVEEMKNAPDQIDLEAVRALARETWGPLLENVAIN